MSSGDSDHSETGETPGGTDKPGDSTHAERQGSFGAAREPKTGDAAPVGIYATVAMVAGLLYIWLCFAGKRGMTEASKRECVSAIAGWSKKGGRCRRSVALAAIFFVLVYYHSIGKCAEAEFGSSMQAAK